MFFLRPEVEIWLEPVATLRCLQIKYEREVESAKVRSERRKLKSLFDGSSERSLDWQSERQVWVRNPSKNGSSGRTRIPAETYFQQLRQHGWH